MSSFVNCFGLTFDHRWSRYSSSRDNRPRTT